MSDWPGQEVTTLPASPVAQPTLRPVISVPPDPLEQQQRESSIASNQANVGNTAHDNALADKNARITQAQTLRQEFSALPETKTYVTVLQSAASALKAEPTPTGDQQLITAYAKALDPNSVVRGEEFETVANADSAAGRLWAKLQKEGGFDNAGLLRPEIRDRIKRGLFNLVQTGQATYQQQRAFYSDLAKRNGLDPFEVVGPDVTEPFKPTLDAFQRQLTPADKGGANNPTNADIYGQGPLQWGDPATGAFDRNAYLQKTYGIDSGTESKVIGFWNANIGNQNLTPEAVKQWYSGQGLSPPTDENIKQGIANAHKGVPFQGVDTTQAEKQYTDALDAAIKARGDNPESMGETAGINLGQGITLNGLDEIAGLGGAARALAQGNNPVAGYQAERDIQRREQDRSEAAHPVAAPVFNVAGGLLTAPIAFGDANTVADAVKAGAALGGVTGFNSGRGAVDSLEQAGVGAAIGGVVGAGGKVAGDALVTRAAAKAAAADAAPQATEGAQVIQAADRLNNRFDTNIQPLPADVGGPGTRMATGAAATLPLGAPQIVKGAQKVTSEAEKAQQAIAAMAGNATTPEAAGEAALSGAQKYIRNSKTKVDALYAKARQLGGDQPVDLATARQVLDQNIAELSQTPGGAPGLEDLKALRAELDDPYPVEGVRNMRTVLRDRFANDGLRSSDIERRVGQVADAAEQDIENSLAAAGKSDAAKAYRAAADAHKERIGVIDTVLAPIIGKSSDNPRSVEEIMRAIDTASKTRGAKLGKFLGSLPPEDASTIRATLISRLGLVSAGRQDAEGTAFSLNDFLTHWNQLSGSAKAQLFGGELRAALDDLAQVAQGTKEAQRFENSSKTGAAVGQLATGALLARILYEPITAVGGLVLQGGMGRLLSSPSFARWLAKMPKDPALAQRHIQALTKVASADATVAPEILNLQQHLFQAFAGPTKLAAQPNSGTSTTAGGQQ